MVEITTLVETVIVGIETTILESLYRGIKGEYLPQELRLNDVKL